MSAVGADKYRKTIDADTLRNELLQVLQETTEALPVMRDLYAYLDAGVHVDIVYDKDPPCAT